MKKRMIVLSVLVLLIFSASIATYANNSTNLDVQAQKHIAKVNERLSIGYEDIVKTYEIDKNNYIKCGPEDIGDLVNGKIVAIDNLDSTKLWDILVYDFMNQHTIGSLEPVILAKNDGKEILFMFKDKDGNNICLKASKNTNNQWETGKEIRKGQPILAITTN
ncbi:hypothetical protein [Dehalobacterium formicoaceticum]|uniref:Uncharacterized protein n=1 Tax=Dehalobacterium formicoaceticum TaxID=51515 RepID=A0ABT1Y182_9FIRM|nr:hypothetical protein [Dehalobacterium formicoaceticum]MCR6544590.1 hypothetical protein [Dehalobacterium formicoaceticum]